MARMNHGDEAATRHSPFITWVLAGTITAMIIGVGLFVMLGRGLPGPASTEILEPLWEVPTFNLVERSGRSVTKSDLLGMVWIADFIFTGCVDACPLLSHLMSKLQTTFASDADFRLVSISLDPVHDTPAVLSQYANRFHAHPQRWLFLTGDKKHIYDLTRSGFRLGAFDPNELDETSNLPQSGIWRLQLNLVQGWLEPALALADHPVQRAEVSKRDAIQHSGRLVLIDRRGQIRRYYDSKDEDVLQRLTYHVALLLREP